MCLDSLFLEQQLVDFYILRTNFNFAVDITTELKNSIFSGKFFISSYDFIKKSTGLFFQL